MIRSTLAAIVILASATLYAQAPAPATTPATTTATTATIAPISEMDSRQTREDFRNVLRRYPPQLATVLRLDPTLFNNQQYMTNYPALVAFTAQHPEVLHNSGYFLEGMGDYYPSEFRQQHQIMGDIAAFLAFLVITSVVVWIIKTVVDHRRWNRVSATQSEVHRKLLDRFSTNEELLAYLQSDTGKRFLESAPIAIDAAARPISAPLGRILWSVQIGLVMIAGGIGFDLVSLRARGPEANVLYGFGVTALLIGIALLVSAAIFYVVSRRFGLWTATES